MVRFFKTYALGIILAALWLGSWVGQWLTHDGDFSKFLNATFENLQSEYNQLFTFVVLSAYFVFRGSPQSKDGSDRMEQKIDSIMERIERIENQ